MTILALRNARRFKRMDEKATPLVGNMSMGNPFYVKSRDMDHKLRDFLHGSLWAD